MGTFEKINEGSEPTLAVVEKKKVKHSDGKASIAAASFNMSNAVRKHFPIVIDQDYAII